MKMSALIPGDFVARFMEKSMSTTQSPGLLSTWKEIASYIGRGVRTAQRYERQGLPVRRLMPGPRASVTANSHEIDVWLRHVEPPAHPPSPSPVSGDALRDSREIQRRMKSFREDLCRQYVALASNMKTLEITCRELTLTRRKWGGRDTRNQD
jgi:hypothetical protein